MCIVKPMPKYVEGIPKCTAEADCCDAASGHKCKITRNNVTEYCLPEMRRLVVKNAVMLDRIQYWRQCDSPSHDSPSPCSMSPAEVAEDIFTKVEEEITLLDTIEFNYGRYQDLMKA